jgi:poly-D-alanine transfer protein DltD
MQAQAQQTIADSVLKNTYLLIEALKDNYRQYSIRGSSEIDRESELCSR